MAERKPLSLNERNQRLLQDLSRSRPSKPPEHKAHKVKIEGRRRLCKLSSAPADDPPDEDDDAGYCDESIRGILDDLTSRLDALSVERRKPEKPGPLPDNEPDYESAKSSLSSASPPANKDEGMKKRANKIEKAWKPLRFDEDDDDGCMVLGSDRRQKHVGGTEEDAVEEIKERENKIEKASKPLSFDDEDEDDGCVVLGSDRRQECVSGTEEDAVECLSSDDDGYGRDGGGDRDGKELRLVGSGKSKSRDYVLLGKIVKMLYPHQREGLKWLWALHCGGTGGILGDDMGLGKTMQMSAYLAGLFHSCLINRALIVSPKTLIGHWMKELTAVGLSDKIRDYSGASAKMRQYELQDVLKGGGVLLTTYDIVRNNSKSIRGDSYLHGEKTEEETTWDYIVLDEGHIIKNLKTQRAQSLLEIPSSHRIIISGTPIQNNLKELWALFNFCCPELLGDKDEFKVRYEHAILRGNDKNASDREKHVGSTVAKELRERIKPYFLRRLKSEVFQDADSTKSTKLSKKNEIIVWLKLTSCQRQLYEAFLKSEWVHSSINGSPLAALTILKKICDHPLLLTKRAAEGVLEGMDSMLNREELSMVEEMAMNLANMTYDDDGAFKVDHKVSCKISFIMSLLENLVEEGHIVLIFSQTRKMLNLIQEVIISTGYKFLRIDGTTKVSEREKIVEDFQEGSGAPIFLLTSQVGGLGLTLTKADRVIVVDPAWNPSTDNQSVDRAYRIGQKKDVLVYRLMTCGTIEEKIYKMQVFKGGLFRTATEHREQTRYFSQKDIRELFSLPEQGFDVSLTQQQLQEEHDRQHTMDDSLMNHVKFLNTQGIAGVSHHSLLYSKTATVPFVREHAEVLSKPGNKIIRSSPSSSSMEHVVNGGEFAFKPKDAKFSSRADPFSALANEVNDSPEQIEERIRRLSQTLANKALVSRLPDQGDKIQKQILDLTSQLHIIRDSPTGHVLERKEPDVINLDDLTEDLQKVLSV